MRLWTLHPQYLDRQGLLALWREGLLTQKVRLGRTRGYRRHPQLTDDPTRRTATIFVVVLSSFLAPFMISALTVALPAIGEQFALHAMTLGWIVTSYILAAAVCMLPFGRLADIYGRRKMFLRGMIVYTVGSFLSASAPSAAWLIAARVVNGVGAAMGFATGMAILMSVVAPNERGRALGWNVAAVYLGLSVGPVLGGLITHALGWRWIFGINAIAGLVAVLLVLWKLKGEWAEARGERFDLAGSLLCGSALVAFMVGCSLLPKAGGAVLIVVSGLGLVAFVRWERRSSSPVFNVTLFAGNAVFAFANVAALINYAATAAVAFLLSLYLEYCRDLSPQQTGFILMAQPAVMAVFSPMAGRLSDRIAPWKLASLGMGLTVVGLVAFSFLHDDSSLGHVVAGLGVLGFGFALFSSPNTHAVMGSVERKHYGIASGTLSTMRLIGQMTSMAIVMLILALVLGRVQITHANHHLVQQSVRLSFGVFAVLCAIGVGVSLVRGKVTARAAGG